MSSLILPDDKATKELASSKHYDKKFKGSLKLNSEIYLNKKIKLSQLSDIQKSKESFKSKRSLSFDDSLEKDIEIEEVDGKSPQGNDRCQTDNEIVNDG